MTQPVVTAAAYTRAGAPVNAMLDGYGRKWQDELNDTGSGSVTVQADDPAAAVPYGSVIRFALDGADVFGILVETRATVAVAPGEEVDEATTLSGRGLLAVLEEAVVEPAAGVDRAVFTDTRLFNFAAVDYDDTGWASAVESDCYEEDDDGNPLVPCVPVNFPDGWPDTTSHRVWDRDSNSNGVPAGEVYFRKEFTAPSDVNAEVWVVADDNYELWIDGQQVVSDVFDATALFRAKYVELALDAGTHTLAVHGTNTNALKAFVMWTVVVRDGLGNVTAVLDRSDSTALVLGYPTDPPGFTPGKIVRLLVEEAQARGAVGEVTLTFDDYDDTAADPWPVTADVSLQVGTDLLSVIRQLAESYFDVRMGTGFELSAWSTAGTVTAVAYASGAITELRHEGRV